MKRILTIALCFLSISSASAGVQNQLMNCEEAQFFFTTYAMLKDQGNSLSTAHYSINRSPGFNEHELKQLRDIVSSLYTKNLSPEQAKSAAIKQFCK